MTDSPSPFNSLAILFEDDDLIVVDKPGGQFVHPSPGHETGTLTDALVAKIPSLASVGSRARPGVVHRLDAETSGVMVFAKTQRAYYTLREFFESHTRVKKTYLAIVHGSPKTKTGTLETLIGRKPWDPKRMAVNVPDGARALTHWRVLAKRESLSLIEFKIETGRTHQIRVHAAHLMCPIVGDALYGNREKDARLRVKPKRQLLHAVELAFPHPTTKKMVAFMSPPPSDLVYCL